MYVNFQYITDITEKYNTITDKAQYFPTHLL